MSKSDGKIIAIKFDLPLVGDVSGNEDAFTVSGQEYLYTDGANHNKDLSNKNYRVDMVQIHPTEPNSIQLLMKDYIRNVQGNITVKYNQALGNLAGIGGAVASFQENFTPDELEEGLTNIGGKYGTHENIGVGITGSVELKRLIKDSAYNHENVDVSIGGTIKLIHIDDINP